MGSSLDLKPLETPCMLEKEERDQQPLVRVCQNIVRAEAWFLSLIRCHQNSYYRLVYSYRIMQGRVLTMK